MYNDMKEPVVAARNVLLRFAYVKILKNIFFLFDPEVIHDRMVRVGVSLGRYRLWRGVSAFFFGYAHPSLEQTVFGVHFMNPIGLAAGFDKNAEMTDILPAIGFGFAEVGSITGEVCDGNPKPRLWRLKKSRSLLVYYGLKNDGCEKIAGRLRGKGFRLPIGISIAKTNDASTVAMEAGIADYVKAYRAFEGIGDYVTINISCPNAYGGCPFTSKPYLEALCLAIDKERRTEPVFIKLSPDLSEPELDDIIDVARRYGITGFVSTNLTKKRENNRHIKDTGFSENGGMSGAIVRELSDKQIRYLYGKTHGEFVIIGCGGVSSARDAYRKIRLGASIVQLVTGMIYQGPQVVSEINQGLVKLLRRDGLATIGEAVGLDNREKNV